MAVADDLGVIEDFACQVSVSTSGDDSQRVPGGTEWAQDGEIGQTRVDELLTLDGMAVLSGDLGLDVGHSLIWLCIDREELLLQCFDCNLHPGCLVESRVRFRKWRGQDYTRKSDHLQGAKFTTEIR